MVTTTEPHAEDQTITTSTSTWEIDPSHSLVEFAVKHMVFATAKGRFSGVVGTIQLDEADPSRSSVAVEIDAMTIDSRDEKRDAHLRSGDFFNVEQHPTLSFRSTRVETAGEGKLSVIGDLTMRGVSKPVTLEASYNGRGTNPWGQEVIGYSGQTEVNRKDWGLEWNAPLEAGGVLVADTVKIALEIEAARAA